MEIVYNVDGEIMKRLNSIISVFTLILMMMFVPEAYAADNTLIIAGTTATAPHGLARITVSVTGEAIENISGNINYSPDDLVIFSITPSTVLSDWEITTNSSKAGKISFTASSSETKISSEQILFTVTFVAVNEKIQDTNVTATDLKTSVITVEKVIINQKEIDDAKYDKENAISEEIANSIVIPDPVYGEQEVSNDTPLKDVEYVISIIKAVNGNAYLKSAKFNDGTISPSFNKLTNSYKVIIDDSVTDIRSEMIAEYPTSTVEISDEINNQIVVTVTSENGTVNSYVFSIQRQHNYTPVNNENNEVITQADTSIPLPVLIGLGVISFGIILVGAFYVFQGSREQ